MTINLEKYGELISDKALGEIILTEIKKGLKSSGNVTLDFAEVKSMATCNAKQIFGQLYLKLGPKDFFDKIIFTNTSSSISSIIRLGITDSISNSAELIDS